MEQCNNQEKVIDASLFSLQKRRNKGKRCLFQQPLQTQFEPKALNDSIVCFETDGPVHSTTTNI